MIYTYKSDKGPVTKFAYASNQPHFTKYDSCVGIRTNPVISITDPVTNCTYNKYVNAKSKPNPIKHWRKQLTPYVNNNTVQSHPTIRDIDNAVKTQNPLCSVETDILYINDCIGVKNSNPCVTGSTAIRRSANTIINKNFCWNSKQYLQSRCKTYDQNQQIGTNISDNKYLSGSCINKCKNNVNGYAIIYKPNNKQFQQQGGVSSSSRIAKLKYDTIRNSTNKYDSLLANLDSSSHILNRKPVQCIQQKIRGNRPYSADCKHIVTTES